MVSYLHISLCDLWPLRETEWLTFTVLPFPYTFSGNFSLNYSSSQDNVTSVESNCGTALEQKIVKENGLVAQADGRSFAKIYAAFVAQHSVANIWRWNLSFLYESAPCCILGAREEVVYYNERLLITIMNTKDLRSNSFIPSTPPQCPTASKWPHFGHCNPQIIRYSRHL